MILFLDVCAFPPIPQKNAEWMGLGALQQQQKYVKS
jgi:hypothetical protein